MREKLRAGVLMLGLGAATACVPGYYLTAQRMGAIYVAQAPDCEIRFENLDYQAASARYDIIGMVTLSGASSAAFTPEMKEKVRAKACELGGNATTLNASVDATSNIGGGAGFQFFILRDRPKQAPESSTGPGRATGI